MDHESGAQDATHPLGRFVPALHHRNFRLFSLGQALSIIGTWMQDVAQGWYVLTKTDSAAALGLVMAAEYIPILFLAPLGGAIVDRYDRRKLIAIAQCGLAAVALLLGLAVSFNAALVWIFALAVVRGLVGCIDLPARSAVLSQLVTQERLRSASAFGSLIWNVGRATGPIAAAVLIGTAGIASCFYVNAVSYVLLLVLVLAMHASELAYVPLTQKARVRDGWNHVRENADVRAGLLSLAFIGTFAFNTATIFPMVARFQFAGEVGAAAQLITAAGIGSILCGLYVSRRSAPTRSQVVGTSLVFAAAIAALCFAPSLLVATVSTFLWGAANSAYASTVNSFILLRCAPQFRGRIMAFWSALVFGSTAIGAPIIGIVGEYVSAEASVAMIAVTTVVASGAAAWTFRSAPET